MTSTGPRHPLYPNGEAPAAVCLVGDLHGNYASALLAIEHAAGVTPLAIQLGDFGWWRAGPDTDRYIAALDQRLGSYDMTLLWLDGNHEDFDALYDIPLDADTGLRRIAGRIWHLTRGYRWSWDDRVWMALGGAVSVDRHHRSLGTSWWAQETITDVEVAHASDPGAG
jgi:hypothetical protein